MAHTIIIGAGIGGICMGIMLKRRNDHDFILLEKAQALGGTWRDNRYPGVSCDIPAHIYTYSFEPNADWSRHYAGGEEILRYYDRIARKYGVDGHIRFDQEAVSAHWTGNEWEVRTADGSLFRADVLISACGRLHHPKYPDIEGLDSFSGLSFHSARWPADCSIEGERVGLIGTGSSATQIIAATADIVDRLSVFQRTPQWVLPVANPPIALWRRWLFRLFPGWLKRHVAMERTALEALGHGFVFGKGKEEFRRAVEAPLDQIGDAALREKLTPNYEPGCKRIVMAPDFHAAVQKPKVRVVTEAIDHIEPDGVRTCDGTLHKLDILILATGFKADWYMRPMQITGMDGVTLDDIWADLPLNYRSVALPHMPNLFMINGPFSPGGSAPIVDVIEANVDYILQCLDHIRARKVAISPRRDISESWLQEVRGRGRETVWATGGCRSWYLDKEGVPLYNPISIVELRALLAEPRFGDYVETPVGIDKPGEEGGAFQMSV